MKVMNWLLSKAEEAAPMLKQTAIRLVLEAEKKVWVEKGIDVWEKKAYVAQRLDEMIVLPWWLEPFDGPLFNLLIDIICNRLNEKFGHEWAGVTVKRAVKAMDEA